MGNGSSGGSGLQAAILAEFVPHVRPLTIAADPDQLLADEALLAELDRRGFDTLEYGDPVLFRYEYESGYRQRVPAADRRGLIVLFRKGREALRELPYDLLQKGYAIDISLASLFPGLNRHVLSTLPMPALDILFDAQARHKPDNLGENGTKAFVLRHVYGISPELIRSDADLLTILLNLHLSNRRLPPLLAERLVSQLHRDTGFADWPLLALLTEPNALLEFLQERWPIFLEQLAAEQEQGNRDKQIHHIHDAAAGHAYHLNWPGQLRLPFDVPQVRALVDTLFLEGKLRPVSHPLAAKLKGLWVAVGLRQDTLAERRERLGRLVEQLNGRLPGATASHQEWFSFAFPWAEALLLRHELASDKDDPDDPILHNFLAFQASMDETFQQWLAQRYAFLATLPPHPPVMVHHIASSMARGITQNEKAKVALIVVDGLALEQWLVVRDVLQGQLPALRFTEQATFAWIPTITSVSRQAIFSGSPPARFPTTIANTAAEPTLWTQFWESNGLPAKAIGYEKALRKEADLAKVERLASEARKRVLGLVVDQVDMMMHGGQLGKRGLQQQLRLWLADGFLAALIQRLRGAGYQVALTADHGNIEARGIGSPREQSLANTRGTRVRIYPNETLRSMVQADFPNAIAWPPKGLPEEYWPLLAPNREAFTQRDALVVTHGGCTLDEVIVPFIYVRERES